MYKNKDMNKNYFSTIHNLLYLLLTVLENLRETMWRPLTLKFLVIILFI